MVIMLNIPNTDRPLLISQGNAGKVYLKLPYLRIKSSSLYLMQNPPRILFP